MIGYSAGEEMLQDHALHYQRFPKFDPALQIAAVAEFIGCAEHTTSIGRALEEVVSHRTQKA